jgi:DNA-binding winged helix-turn-helix (wHTH) protein/tetratricopeptide (TPR) repeat protein
MPIQRFGLFEIDAASGELRKRGRRVRLREQPLRVLLALVVQAGSVVTRAHLREQLWPDGTFVGFDRGINKAVSELRAVLGDSARRPRFLETVSKRGYRFTASVEHPERSAMSTGVAAAHSDAQLACMTGRYLWSRRTIRDLHASIACFEQALDIDDACAHAYAGIADSHVIFGIWGIQPPDRAFGSARDAAETALGLDPNLSEAQTSLAEVLKGYEWKWHQAEERYRHALALRPGYAAAHHGYAQLLVSLRRYAEAAAHIEQARRAEPVSPAINAYLPYIYLAGRRYGRALHEARRAVSLEPYAPLAHWQLGRAYLFSGQPVRAVEALECAVTLAGPATMWEGELVYARARAGDRSGALKLVSELVERGRQAYVSPYDLAVAFAGIGECGAALDQLECAVDERVMRVIGLGDPEFDDLHGEPRYEHLLGRLRLPRA